MDDRYEDEVAPSELTWFLVGVVTSAQFWISMFLSGLTTVFTVFVGFFDPTDFHTVGYALGGIAGPFAAALVRFGDARCMAFTGWAALVCVPVLALAGAVQCVPAWRRSSFGIAAWTVGWLVWCLGAVASYL